MESKNSAASIALFLSLNLLFFSMVTATCNCTNPPNHKPTPEPKRTPSTPTPTPKPKPTPSTHSTPSTPKPTPIPVHLQLQTNTYPSTPSTPSTPTTPTPSGGKCSRDALKLGVCANLLGLVNVVVGSPSTQPCCTLIQGLADLEAAVCLCTAIRAIVLGINLNVPVSLTLLLNTCGKKLPSGFQCA